MLFHDGDFMTEQFLKTDLTFFTNEPGSTLLERFVRTLKDVKYFDVLVGYFRSSGFFQLYKSFKNIERVRILVGLNLDKKTFQIIETSNSKDFESHAKIKEIFGKELVSEVESSSDTKQVEDGIIKFIEYLKSGKIEIKAHPSKDLHAKVYISRYHEDDRDYGNVITGSSNFSESGLVANREFNVQLKNSADVKFALNQFELLWKEAVDISDYYVDIIKTKTYLDDSITPYELYLKFLYEYFKQDLSINEDLFFKNFPKDFMQLKYQEQAVVNAKRILEEYGGVFLADVVGLGKTYISALLANQLPGRHLIIASPALLDKDNPNSWPNVFHDFKIAADFESVGKLDKIIEWGTDRYDNVFIDEAHKFRNETNISYEMLARICSGKKVILVTATPLNNTPFDILAQIKLFQKGKNSTIPGIKDLDYFFSNLQKPLKKLDRQKDYDEYIELVKENSQQIRERILKHIMVRRTRSEIANFFNTDLKVQGLKFPDVASPVPVFYELDDHLDKIFFDTIKLIADKNTFTYARYTPLLYLKEELSEFDKTSQRNMGRFMKGLLVKRLESSFFAFKKSLDRFIVSYENFIKAYEKGSVYFSKKYWNRVIEFFLNDDFDAIQQLIDDEKAEAYPATAFVVELKRDLQIDLETLIKIKSWWDKIDYDPKLEKFIKELRHEQLLRNNKLIIFSESKETAEYLFNNLGKQLNEKPILFHGGSRQSDLNTVISNFDAKARHKKDDHRILITTEVLSEGINLHRSNVVINYDIPWNPTRMIQRVGRINRVDTPFDKIYTFNFFPTDQSNDLIELKEAAIAKIKYFIEMLGNDAKLLTDGEEIKSFELFNKLTSKEFITGEDEQDESELKYLNVITEIRDNNKSLFTTIKHLPKKARSSRRIEKGVNLQDESLLTYFRKGKLEKFYLADESMATELDFITAAKLFAATSETKRQKILTNYHSLLEKNKTELMNNLTEEEIQKATSQRGRDNAIRILKILKAKEIRKYDGFTELDDAYIKSVIKLLEDGVLPKSVTKRIYSEIKDLTHPPKIIGAVKCNLPDEFFKGNTISHDQLLEEPSEVILSECFVK
ncbi:helicase [candidate division KSB1 bacterium]|nr:helicase [candidate division KSB1 bacterium]